MTIFFLRWETEWGGNNVPFQERETQPKCHAWPWGKAGFTSKTVGGTIWNWAATGG